MKEVDNRPVCPHCGKIHEDISSCYSWLRGFYHTQDFIAGCSICGQSMVLAMNKSQVCCSNPQCPGWKVRKNGEVYYSDKLIFSASWKAKTITAYSGYEAHESPDCLGQVEFYKKLFYSIIKEKSKNPSNVYKGLRFDVK